MQVQKSEILCLDPCSVQTLAHFSSTQFISFVLSMGIMETAVHCVREGYFQFIPIFCVCFCTFRRCLPIFICRHWPTLLSCTLRTPRNSTSGTCNCTVHCESAVRCCGPGRSKGSHSCPFPGWSCYRSGPASRQSPTRGPSHRSQGTSRSRPDRWCWLSAGVWGGHAPPDLCFCCGLWLAWPRWSAPSAGSPLFWTLESPANRSSADSCPMYHGICISFSCGPPQPGHKQNRWGSC